MSQEINFIPNRHLIFLRLDPEHNQLKSETEIVIVERKAKDSLKGTVVAVGEGPIHPRTGETIPFIVKEGDTVVVGQGAGARVEINGETLLAIREPDIMLILKN